MDVYSQIVVKIIKGQENIIGPIAVEQSQRVDGLDVDWGKQTATITGDPIKVIDELIEKYKELFGQISVEVSKDAVASLVDKLPSNGLPENFK